MGRRYYCEYCDKSFVETPDAVKKHIRGLQHHKMRNEHYARFEDKRKILDVESKKITCKRYIEGNCMFGATCRFSHYTRHELETLKWEVEHADALEFSKKQRTHPYYIMKSWSTDRMKRGLSNSAALECIFIESLAPYEDELSTVTGWTYPSALNDISDLPPSLKKLHLSDFHNEDFAEWG